MGLIEKRTLVSELSPPLDNLLASQLLDEFISMEKRYIQRDWEPAELDGGQFCEVLARVFYHQDSGTLNVGKDFSECLGYIEDEKNQHQNQHAIKPRHDAIHLARVLRTIYKFRSQRGAVHISATYGPNQMDARFLMEAVRWCMTETLRIFWRGDRELVAKAVRELLQFDVPCIGRYEEVLLVERTDLSCEEEVLVLLHFAGEQGFNRKELGQFAMRPSQRITDALRALSSPDRREIVFMPSSERFRLTNLGSKKIREDLSDKLLLH
jgi:hypothetical protein